MGNDDRATRTLETVEIAPSTVTACEPYVIGAAPAIPPSAEVALKVRNSVRVVLKQTLHVGAEGGRNEQVGVVRVRSQRLPIGEQLAHEGVVRVEDRIWVGAVRCAP